MNIFWPNAHPLFNLWWPNATAWKGRPPASAKEGEQIDQPVDLNDLLAENRRIFVDLWSGALSVPPARKKRLQTAS